MSKALNLKIEGMTCPIAGTASLMVNDDVDNSLIGDAVAEAGYKLVSVNG